MEIYNKTYFVIFMMTFSNAVEYLQELVIGVAHPLFVVLSVLIFLATAFITIGDKNEAI